MKFSIPQQTVNAFIIPLLVTVAIVVIRRLFPPSRQNENVAPGLGEYTDPLEVKRWKRLSSGLVFIFAPLTGYGVYQIFALVGSLLRATLPSTSLGMFPPVISYAIPSILIGILLGGWSVELVGRLKFGARERVISEALDREYGMNSQKVKWLLTLLFGLPALGLTVVLWNSYLEVGPSELVIHGWRGAERHSYSEVLAVKSTNIVVAPNGRRVKRTAYIIEFGDGSFWCSDRLPYEYGPSYDTALKAVLQHTGKQFEQVESYACR